MNKKIGLHIFSLNKNHSSGEAVHIDTGIYFGKSFSFSQSIFLESYCNRAELIFGSPVFDVNSARNFSEVIAADFEKALSAAKKIFDEGLGRAASDRILFKNVHILNPHENGGQSISLEITFIWNGDNPYEENNCVFMNQSLSMESYGRTASFILTTCVFTPENLTRFADELEQEINKTALLH